MDPVTCPSCGSKYNPETRELIEDSKLRERIREMESDAQTLRDASAVLQTKLTDAEAQLAIFNAPKPKARDFVVGSR